MRPHWRYPIDPDEPPEQRYPKATWLDRLLVVLSIGAIIGAVCLYSCTAKSQDAPTVARIGGPAPPIPPLRPILAPTNSNRIITNANGDVIAISTVVIKRADPKRHYYGVINSELSYLGEWTSAEYEKWAYTGSQATANQPEIVRWNCIFATTNRITEPSLVHVKLCP